MGGGAMNMDMSRMNAWPPSGFMPPPMPMMGMMPSGPRPPLAPAFPPLSVPKQHQQPASAPPQQEPTVAPAQETGPPKVRGMHIANKMW